jgi:hypothetical protein
MSQEIWNVGGITQSWLFLSIKHIDDRVVHAGVTFEMYDSYPGTPWNGGRPTSAEPVHTLDDFVQKVEQLNRNGIGFNLTFSNLLLEETHLDDERGNRLLERFHDDRNGVIVGSDVLARYIRKTFPKYKLINTLTHYRRDPDYYRKALDLYDLLVLPPALNDQLDLIRELGPERVEILVNETCHGNCPFSQEHYTKISKYNLSLGKNPYLEAELKDYCQKHHRRRLWPMSAQQLRRELVGTYLPAGELEKLKALGVNRFKLRARTSIGGVHDDVFSDISTFILNRMESSEIVDMTHFVSSILSLNMRGFKALY